ncbi:sugar phosphate isomerase/epimerase family protein [Arthrobacter silvisoli]|uniref:sugar phosphate isomerase/epimerase family protein n=1 Tax=Arthrobacter silvisoli TaxID=2291022 RepID=UPI000E2116E6|nr:sugar phosphate isomerase/epimerase [Arthrobacter silvisoli]
MTTRQNGPDADCFVASFFTLSGSGFGQPPRHTFTDRVQAAADAGYAGIGLHLNELSDPDWNELGTDDPSAVLAHMSGVLRGTGLDVVEIEFMGGWCDGPGNPAVAKAADLVGEVAGHLATNTVGGHHVSVGEFGAGPAADPQLAGRGLAELAAFVAGTGYAPAVEAFAWSKIRDYGLVREIQAIAGTGGALADTWHAFNTDCSTDGIAKGEMGPITAVQLNGGYRVHEDFLANARSTRRLPGDGDLDGAGFVRAVRTAGFTGPWCVEVNYPEFRALDSTAAARSSISAARTLVAQALEPS